MWISFDLDGVLMRNPFREGVFPELSAAMAPAFGGEPRRALEAIMAEYFRRLALARQAAEGRGVAAGGQSEHEADPASPYDWDAIVASAAAGVGLEGFPPEPIAAIVRRYAARPGYVAFQHPTVPAALERLAQQGHRLVVVTNGLWSYQQPVLEALGIAGRFERVAAPDLTGAAKPSPEAFRAAFGAAGSPEAVHVGDDLLYDVAGARRAGLRAIWVMPPRLGRLPHLRTVPPWERPAALAGDAAWQEEIERSLERRPAVDRELVRWALPDAAVVHVGEVPAVMERWAEQDRSPARRGRRGARWEVPVLPLPGVGEALVAWFDRAQRPLPWRQAGDPYAVLVSEFMLQQTQVATVIPYYRRFMARFPTLEALASAELDEVLALWQGLGYYRRARHLHETARLVVERHGGRIPDDPAVLRTLPGIGPYMAGAIASIAYGRPEPAIDGNAMRVLSRLLLEWAPPGPAAARRLAAWARAMIPQGRASAFTQGLMELGSTICRPAQPLCGACPVQRFCSAWAYRLQEELPVRRAASPVPVEQVAAAVVVDAAGRVLLVRRGEDGLLGRLWALPAAPVRDGEAWEQAARRAVAEQAGVEAEVVKGLGETVHVFSHRRWQLRGFLMRPAGQARPLEQAPSPEREPAAAEPRPVYGDGKVPAVQWVAPEALPNLPMGRAFRRVLELAGGIPAGALARRAAP